MGDRLHLELVHALYVAQENQQPNIPPIENGRIRELATDCGQTLVGDFQHFIAIAEEDGLAGAGLGTGRQLAVVHAIDAHDALVQPTVGSLAGDVKRAGLADLLVRLPFGLLGKEDRAGLDDDSFSWKPDPAADSCDWLAEPDSPGASRRAVDALCEMLFHVEDRRTPRRTRPTSGPCHTHDAADSGASPPVSGRLTNPPEADETQNVQSHNPTPPGCQEVAWDVSPRTTDADSPAKAATRRHTPTGSPSTSGKPRPCRSPFIRLWPVIALLLAGFCGWMAFTSARPGLDTREIPAAQTALSAQSDTSTRYVTAAIQDVQIADWVLADNPELPDSTPDTADDIDPASWRVIRAEMDKPDGGRLNLALLRPVGWIEEFGAVVGGTIELDLAELGAEGPATVTAVEPCPEIAERPHPGCRLVTGTFSHTATNVVDLQLEGQPHPIGVTATHPFWSAERRAFVPAGDLKEGELVGTRRRHPPPPRPIPPPPPPPRAVFNLEVDTEHVYYVTRDGVLVHNKCGAGKPKSWSTQRKNYWKARAKAKDAARKYSAKNLKRMKRGLAPKIRARVKNLKTGKSEIRDISMELHHKYLPQRGRAGASGDPWNLEEVTPWAHEGMDPFRHTGTELEGILNGPGTWGL